MKIKFFSLILLCSLLFGKSLHAQVSISSSAMPTFGDTLRYSLAIPDSSVLFSYLDTGANQSWNFENLIPLRQNIDEYLNSSQTPYAISGKIAQKFADTLNLIATSLYDVYDFSVNNSSSYQLNQRAFTIPTGLAFPFPSTLQFSPDYIDPDEIYNFPLEYQDRDSNTFNFTFTNTLIGVYYSSVGYRINEVEAWGSITTPYGTFNCIKVKTDIVRYDTVSFGQINFGNTVHEREYKWLSPQLRIPVATLSGSVIGDLYLPGNIQYRDSARKDVPMIFSPVALFNADTTTVKINDTLQFNNFSFSPTPPTYIWDIQPLTFRFASGYNFNSFAPRVIFLDSGYYDIRLIVENGQGRDSLLLEDYIYVEQAVGNVEYLLNNDAIKIGPNPLHPDQELLLQSASKVRTVKLFDLKGQELNEWQIPGTYTSSIELGDLPNGSYLLIIQTDDGRFSKKLLIQ